MKALCLVLLATLALHPRTSGAAEPFHALLGPTSVTAPVGAIVTATCEVGEPARQFNGYEVTLRYDPTILTFVGASEGALMSGACATRFTNLSAPSDSTVVYAHALLCQGVNVSGPGVLSLFRFRVDHPQSTTIRILSNPDRSFYDAGLYISPQHPTYPRQVQFDQEVVVNPAPTSLLDPADAQPEDQGLEIIPNPVRAEAVVRFAVPSPGRWELKLVDPSGRVCARWGATARVAELVNLRLDRGDVGWLPSAGVYFLALDAGGASRVARCVLLP